MKTNDKHGLTAVMIISCAIIFSITTLLLTPIYVYTVSDAVTAATLLPDVLELLTDIAELAAFAICYSLVIFAAVHSSLKSAMRLCGVYTCAVALRRAASLAVSLLEFGSIGLDDVVSVAIYAVLDTAQIFAVAAIAAHCQKKCATGVSAKKASGASTMEVDACRVSDIKFRSVYSPREPLQRSALLAGIMLAAIKIISRIIFDIFYGAPEGISEIAVMTAYYLSDILTGVCFYALSTLIFYLLLKKREHLKDR